MTNVCELEKNVITELSVEIRDLLNCYRGMYRCYELYDPDYSRNASLYSGLPEKEQKVVKLLEAIEGLLELKKDSVNFSTGNPV